MRYELNDLTIVQITNTMIRCTIFHEYSQLGGQLTTQNRCKTYIERVILHLLGTGNRPSYFTTLYQHFFLNFFFPMRLP